jgi:predicted phage terminase large subunit-like protein
MLRGGSRSGKTFLIVRAIVVRALAAPRSRHAILRFRFNHVKASIIHDTFPKVMDLCFPGVPYHIDRADWYAKFPIGSEIWFGGLDDKERTEKILGQEHATLFLNEVSQIPWTSRNLAVTRLAQKIEYEIDGKRHPLRLKMFYDCNPPSSAHWSHRVFIAKRDPETNQALRNPADFASMLINPKDNAENLPAGYLDSLAQLSPRMRLRFLDGQFSDATQGALWAIETIEKWRTQSELPDMQRIVVSVDPSGAGDDDNTDNDAIGIIVAGLGTDGNGYVLEDLTVKAGPAVWGNIATTAYDRHRADKIVAETNFGGEMVRFVVQTAKPKVPFRKLTASRGKVVRAEPIAALTDQGKIRFAGSFPELEDELCAFTTKGYTGEKSPNRADAFVWAMTELFPGMTKETPQAATQMQHSQANEMGMFG